ncbi:hypothetical protein [Methanosarcina sp. KYL-1]|uniref:hypothetical protein n=1 Tax=Methanosarcina sp. KYL-1 TaxID=2602068 RepID=UPI0021008671|nr:hypothetical protein [Methanosarcina sp. KYL-1]
MSGEQDKEKEMDERRKKNANKIIDKMVENGASRGDIAAQKKANKELLGHEGDPDI